MKNEDYVLELDLDPEPIKKAKKAIRSISATISPFAVMVDSREQLPYGFDHLDVIVPIGLVGLASGDYSIQGLESEIAIERKSLADLYGSCTWGRDRFEHEIERLNALNFAAVVIEATWPEIANPTAADPTWRSQASPESILGTITSWSVRYRNVPWWAVGPREECERQVYRCLPITGGSASMIMPETYECDGCGACCRQLIVEVDIIDVLREPKLRRLRPHKCDPSDIIDDDTVPPGWDDRFREGATLVCGKSQPCPFLKRRTRLSNFSEPTRCSIYATRPSECVGFLAGSSKCQEVRSWEGLEPLLPTKAAITAAGGEK